MCRKKTTTWPSTVAGILSSGCPRFFKSGQKEFNKETGWWALQENVAPEIKFNEIGTKRDNYKPYLRFSLYISIFITFQLRFRKLIFQGLALHSEEGLMLELSAF